MTSWIFTQYQAKAQPPEINQPGPGYESQWHQPWSTPPALQRKIKPALAIALMASGLFAPILGKSQPGPENMAPWSYPWSEPVRFKINKKLAIALAASGPFQPVYDDNTTLARTMPWYAPLSEPKRFKLGLLASLQQFDSLQVPVQPQTSQFIQWYANLSEPVRLKKGMRAPLQRAYFSPDRLLPTPNVTVTIAATEINTDVAIFALNVYNAVGPITSGAGARVSITEVPAFSSSPSSIRES